MRPANAARLPTQTYRAALCHRLSTTDKDLTQVDVIGLPCIPVCQDNDISSSSGVESGPDDHARFGGKDGRPRRRVKVNGRMAGAESTILTNGAAVDGPHQ